MYCAGELKAFQNWKIDRKNEKLREKYYNKIGKFKEKPKDRRTPKGKSFCRMFNEEFDHVSNSFHESLYQKAYETVRMKEHFYDICDKTLDFVFESQMWKLSSQDCMWLSYFKGSILKKHDRKQPEQNRCSFKSKPDIPCLGHCTDSVLNNWVESSLEAAYEKTLEENLQKISKSITLKAWEKAGESNFKKIILKSKDDLYRKAFAKFYHDNSFIQICNDAEASILGDVRNDMQLIDMILAKSEVVKKLMSDFIKEKFDKEIYITEDHLNTWSNWLREEKKVPQRPIYGYESYPVWPLSSVLL